MAAKSTVKLSEDDKKIVLAVYNLLKWKGLVFSAKRLAKEASFSKEDISPDRPSAGQETWEVLRQSVLKNGSKADDSESESSSDSESSSSESEVSPLGWQLAYERSQANLRSPRKKYYSQTAGNAKTVPNLRQTLVLILSMHPALIFHLQ